ncbi:hypothetical protein [Exiguobacterium sp. LL15]|uniref:hypothetical protein n=1 Tax=Exiguobacterium sp. LL15 TaxID=2950547 RepID=UPI00210BA693|nr:hypothetical protein [Exiguobacterium sp. LL15]MCQ4090636.1 hypothetical protein [Exiguobacterium sp. LL15]
MVFNKKSITNAVLINIVFFIIVSILSYSFFENPNKEITHVLNRNHIRVSEIFSVGFIGEFLLLLILTFSILLYSLLATTQKIEITKFYISSLIERIKVSDLKWHIATFFVMLILNSIFVNYKNAYNYIYVFPFLIWLIVFSIKYIVNLKKEYFFTNYLNVNLNDLFHNYERIVFFVSLFISIGLVIPTKLLNIIQIPFLHFFVNLMLLIFIATISNIIKIINLEYLSAKLHKQIITNKYIFDCILNSLKDDERKEFLEKTKINIKNSGNYRLNSKRIFMIFLKDLNLNNILLEKRIKKNYQDLIVDPIHLSNSIGEVVKQRNSTNFLVSLFLIPLTYIFIIFLKTNALLNSTIDLILKVFFILILFRLIMRSIEIGHAFYRDIQPTVKIKKTNLSNRSRIKLVIYSLFEVTLLSSVLYLFSKIILLKEFTPMNLLSIYIENIEYSIGVAFFNVSFPLTYLDKVNHLVSEDYWSLPSAIRIIHAIQLIISIILVSLSITSYSSRERNLMAYSIEFLNDYYVISETNINNKKNRVIFKSSSKKGLKMVIERAWKNNRIGSDQYLELNELVNIYALKKIN